MSQGFFPSFRWVSVTPSDTVNFLQPSGKNCADAIYVGAAGNVVLVLEDGSTLTIPAPAGGYIWNNRVKRINATSTTASQIFALYAL